MPGKVHHNPSREGSGESVGPPEEAPLKESVVPEGVYCNTRMTRSLSLMIGATVNLKTGEGYEYEGIIEAISPKLEVILRMAHLTEHGNGSGVLKEREVCVKKEHVHDKLMFGINDITEIVLITEYDSEPTKGFLDGEISGNGRSAGGQKDLVEWVPEDEDHSLHSAPSNHRSSQGWEPTDMFRRNEEITGTVTSYNEEMTQYSNVPVPDDDGTAETRAARLRAEALAREIESNPASRKNIELENEDEEVDLDGSTNRPRRQGPADNSNWRSSAPGPQGAGREMAAPVGRGGGGGRGGINRGGGGRGGRGGGPGRGGYPPAGPPPQLHAGQTPSYGPRVINRSQPPPPPQQDPNINAGGNYGGPMRPNIPPQSGRYQGEASPPSKDDGGGWETASRQRGNRRGGPGGRGAGPPPPAHQRPGPDDAARLRQWSQDFKLAGPNDNRGPPPPQQQYEERKTPPPMRPGGPPPQQQRQPPQRYAHVAAGPPLPHQHQPPPHHQQPPPPQDIRLQGQSGQQQQHQGQQQVGEGGDMGVVAPSESMDSSPGITAKMQVDQRKKTPDQPSRKNSDAGSVSSAKSGAVLSKLNPDAAVFTPRAGGITSPPSTPLLGVQSPQQHQLPPQPHHLIHTQQQQQPLIPGGPSPHPQMAGPPQMGYPPPAPSPAHQQMPQYHPQQPPASLMSVSTPQPSQVAYSTAFPPPTANPNMMMQQQYPQQQQNNMNNNNNNNRQRKGGMGGGQTSLVGQPIVAGSAPQAGAHPGQYPALSYVLPGNMNSGTPGGFNQPMVYMMTPHGARGMGGGPGQYMVMEGGQMAVSGPSGSYATVVSSAGHMPLPPMQQPPPPSSAGSNSQPPTPGPPNPSPHTISQPPPNPAYQQHPYPPPHQLHNSFNPGGMPTIMTSTSGGVFLMQPYGAPGAYASFPQQQMQMDPSAHHQAQMAFAQQQHLQQQHPGQQLVMSMAGPMPMMPSHQVVGPPVAGQVVPQHLSSQLPPPHFRRPAHFRHPSAGLPPPPPRPASVSSLPPSS